MGQGRIILGFVFPIHEWKSSLLKPDHISFVYPPRISFDPLFMLSRFLVSQIIYFDSGAVVLVAVKPFSVMIFRETLTNDRWLLESTRFFFPRCNVGIIRPG